MEFLPHISDLRMAFENFGISPGFIFLQIAIFLPLCLIYFVGLRRAASYPDLKIAIPWAFLIVALLVASVLQIFHWDFLNAACGLAGVVLACASFFLNRTRKKVA